MMSGYTDQIQLESFLLTLAGIKTAALSQSIIDAARALGTKPRFGAGALLGGSLGALGGAGTTPRGEEPSIGRRAAIGAALGALGGAGAAKGVHWLGAGKVPGTERLARMLHAQYYGLTGRLLDQGKMSPLQFAGKLKELDVGPQVAQEAIRAAKPGTNLKPLQARLEAAKRGIDTLPGMLRGLATSPASTLRAAWNAQAPLGKVVTLGSIAFPIREIRKMKPEDYGPGKEYLSRRQQIAAEMGRNLGYVAGGAAPVAPLIAAGTLLGEAGKTIGSVI